MQPQGQGKVGQDDRPVSAAGARAGRVCAQERAELRDGLFSCGVVIHGFGCEQQVDRLSDSRQAAGAGFLGFQVAPGLGHGRPELLRHGFCVSFRDHGVDADRGTEVVILVRRPGSGHGPVPVQIGHGDGRFERDRAVVVPGRGPQALGQPERVLARQLRGAAVRYEGLDAAVRVIQQVLPRRAGGAVALAPAGVIPHGCHLCLRRPLAACPQVGSGPEQGHH